MSTPVTGYGISHPVYYDRPERSVEPGRFLLLLQERAGERAHTVDGSGIWARCLDRPLADLPPHGWKLHVSSRLGQARTVIEGVLEEFLVEPFSFKCVRDPDVALWQQTRWWPRGGAAKTVTVYPASQEHARELAERLSARLAGLAGPHILTDRRWPGSDVVQYRYATFHRGRGIDSEGRLDTAVSGPGGAAWDDNRDPRFSLPPWVDRDPFADPGAPTPEADPTGLLRRHTVTSVLRHSTAGGVYLASAEDGSTVVLKEARPHVAVGPDGSDAVERLHREHEYLRALEGTGVGPRALEIATVWEHTFLVQSQVPGITLQRWLSRNLPYATGRPDPGYLARARRIVEQVAAAVRTCREHGVVYNDMSLTNVMVDDDDTARLVDFESCRPVGSDPGDFQRTSGFAPRPGSPAWESDEAYLEFGLAALEAAVVMPRDQLLEFRPEVHARALTRTGQHLGVEVADLVRRLERGRVVLDGRDTEVGPQGWADLDDVVDAVVRGVRASATPERRDRLFPGDREQFAGNALNLAYGAAGVLRGLQQLDGTTDPDHVDWLEARVLERTRPVSVGPLPPGLYTGTAGIGLVLRELGRDDHGLVAAAVRRAERTDLPAGVLAGTAGVALAALAAHRTVPDERLLEGAERLADRLVLQAEDDGTGLWWPVAGTGPQPLGLMHGSAGAALALTEVGLACGRDGLVALGARALGFDLAHGRTRANGGLGFGVSTEGTAYEPYVGRGGAGVGMALAHVAARTGDPALLERLAAVVRGVGMRWAHNPGYLTGMAGIVDFLVDTRELLGPDLALGESTLGATVQALLEQIWSMRCLDVVDGDVHLGFPGDSLVRQSCDVATGSIGVALVARRALLGGPTWDVRTGTPLAARSRADLVGSDPLAVDAARTPEVAGVR